MWLLFAFVFSNFGWQLFDNGPLANYVITGLLVFLLSVLNARKSELWVVYLYGGVMGLCTSACGGMFILKMDGYAFLCDKGTGIPVSLISGLGAVGVAGYLLARKKT